MNLNRFMNLVIAIVARRVINAGINKGIELFSRRSKPSPPPTSEDEKHRLEARATAKRARQAAKLTRRIGR